MSVGLFAAQRMGSVEPQIIAIVDSIILTQDVSIAYNRSDYMTLSLSVLSREL